jgi:hypothetical protein
LANGRQLTKLLTDHLKKSDILALSTPRDGLVGARVRTMNALLVGAMIIEAALREGQAFG